MMMIVVVVVVPAKVYESDTCGVTHKNVTACRRND